MAKKSKVKSDDPILDELTAIKNLLILALYGNDFPSEQIGKAVMMDPSAIRGMFTKKSIKKSRAKG